MCPELFDTRLPCMIYLKSTRIVCIYGIFLKKLQLPFSPSFIQKKFKMSKSIYTRLNTSLLVLLGHLCKKNKDLLFNPGSENITIITLF